MPLARIAALVVALAIAVPALAQDPVSGLHLSGYADLLYARFDYGPDQKSGENGSPPDDRAIMDLQRFVLGVGYEFDPTLVFAAEIEIEHGGTGGALELEYEEFGEYEQEIEKGGEVVLEQLHLTKTFSDAFALRVGHGIVPVGLINLAHLPTSHFGTVRPEAESTLVPVTWHETGVTAFGDLGDFSWQAQLINGLDSTGFSSKFWVRDGHQTRFEQVRATDMAVVGRVQWNGVRGLKVGVSAYRGGTTGNRPKDDMPGVDGTLTLVGADLRWARGPWRLRASWLGGHLDDAAEISAKNSRLSTNLGVARSPVATEARAWGAELGCDVMPLFDPDARTALFPFVRCEQVDTMHGTTGGIFADPRFDRTILTCGLNWFPRPSVAVKADFAVRSLGAERYRDEKTYGASLGLVF
ncbi:hypothetical protein KDM41_07880 [bacterium]|nr:hypothetical protein [bacterium]